MDVNIPVVVLDMTRGVRGYGCFGGPYHILNATMVQSKNCLFAVNTTIQLNSVTSTSDNNGIYRAVFRLRSVPILSGVVIFLSSIVVLTRNVKF